MKILIIGGTGLLSGAVATEVVRNGHELICINRGNHSQIKGANLILSDKDKYDYLERKLHGLFFDAVIDFLVRKEDELQRSFEFYSRYTKQYVFISTTMVYNSSLNMTFDEDAPKVQQLWSYSKEKWDCEQRLMQLTKLSNCYFTIVRPGITYDDTRIPYSVMPPYGKHYSLIARMKAGKPLIAINAGMSKCNIIRAEDFAVGVVGLLGNENAYNEAFNVCGNETPTFKEVLDEVAKVLNVECKIIDVSSEIYAQLVPNRGDEIKGRSFDYVCSNDKIKKIVPSFDTQISLYDGVSRVVNSYIASGNLQIDYAWDAECDKVASVVERSVVNFVDYNTNASLEEKKIYHKIIGNKIRYYIYKYSIITRNKFLRKL